MDGARRGGSRGRGPGLHARHRPPPAGADGIEVVDTSSTDAFLASLRDAKVLSVEERPEATAERLERDEIDRVLGDGPIAFGKDVEPGDLDDV